MLSYTHRERVLRAIQHQPVDRIPMDMMGHATMLLDRTYLRLRDYLKLTPIPPARSGSTANYYDERILEYFDIDFRRIWLKSSPNVKKTVFEDGSYEDTWGIRYQVDGLFVTPVGFPLQKATTVEEIETYPWPAAEDMFSAAGLTEEAKHLYNHSDYALVARNPLTLGLFDRACALMGNAEFMMALAGSPDVAQTLLDHLLTFYLNVYRMFLDAVGPYVQMIEYGDDLGGQQYMLISPAMYRTFLKPADQALCNLMRTKAPAAMLFRHCDGNIFKIIPDLIEIGIDVLNPVQTSAKDMQGRRLKENFGNSLTFHGGVERMEATSEELRVEIIERIDTFAPGGGYIFASCNHIIDVPPENIILMFETAREYGRYKT